MQKVGLVTTLGCAWISIYVLSVGPVFAMIEYANYGKQSAETFYGPVIWLHDETLLKKPLEWYSDLWGWH